MRLIDVDALLETINSEWDIEFMPFTKDGIMNIITNAPTVQREGWKLVPFRDDLITEEMKRALFINLIHADDEAYVIKAIIAAAPKE